jgi:hypothetical protein
MLDAIIIGHWLSDVISSFFNRLPIFSRLLQVGRSLQEAGLVPQFELLSKKDTHVLHCFLLVGDLSNL